MKALDVTLFLEGQLHTTQKSFVLKEQKTATHV